MTGSWGDYFGSWVTAASEQLSYWNPFGAAPQPIGRVVRDAPRFSWVRIKDLSNPYPQGTMSDSDFRKTFGYWFNYLWEEARQTLEVMDPGRKDVIERVFPGLGLQGEQVQTSLCDLFGLVFEISDAPSPRPNKSHAMLDSSQQCSILLSLLLLGFRPHKYTDLSPLPDSSPLFKDHVVYGPDDKKISIAYRCDDRDWNQLHGSGGCTRRVESDSQRTMFGLDEPWHPFSIPEIRECLWFRRGGKNLDNCLHTVVSVGPVFADVIQFPKISDGTKYPRLSRKPFAEWGAQEINDARGYKVELVGPPGAQYLRTTTYVLVFKVEGMQVYDTESVQRKEGGTPYAERGARAIPLDNILARLEVTRRHTDGNGEFDIIGVDFLGNPRYQLLPDEDGVRAKLFGSNDALDAFKALMNRLVTSNPMAAKQFSEQLAAKPVVTAVRRQKNIFTGKWEIRQGNKWVVDPNQND
jgi:hypothetical protein